MNLESDIVVLIPGVTGSVLKHNGKEVWAAFAGAVFRGLFSGGESPQVLSDSSPPDVDDLDDGVKATKLVGDVHIFPGLWKIDGYTKVAKRLQQRMKLVPGETYFELPYDWRRDNRVAARKLKRELETWLGRRRQTHPDAKVVLIAHSMGGVISRYPVEVLGGAADTRALVTFGTPYRGSLNALDSLVNGVQKLRLLDLTELTRSFTSIYQLLPIYPCYAESGGSALIRLKEASELPGIDVARVRAQPTEFHREIERAVTANREAAGEDVERYSIKPVVGIDQPTNQSARRAGDRVDSCARETARTSRATGQCRASRRRRSRPVRIRPRSPRHATRRCRTPMPSWFTSRASSRSLGTSARLRPSARRRHCGSTWTISS